MRRIGRRTVWLALAALAGAGLWRLRELEPVRIEGSSMAPTIPAGARVAVAALPAVLRRDMVVAVAHPQEPGLEIVKRLAGVPGDRVMVGGELVTLAPDAYLLLGDNAAESTDSRSFGPVSRGDLRALVLFVYWPPPAWGRP